MISDIIKVQDKVKHLLDKYPETRDSDKTLWLAYNVGFNGLLETLGTVKYEAFKKWLMSKETPVFESLSRARRKLQSEHVGIGPENKTVRNQEQGAVKYWSKTRAKT